MTGKWSEREESHRSWEDVWEDKRGEVGDPLFEKPSAALVEKQAKKVLFLISDGAVQDRYWDGFYDYTEMEFESKDFDAILKKIADKNILAQTKVTFENREWGKAREERIQTIKFHLVQ